MHDCPKGNDCGGCPMYSGGPVVCRCLGVTEDTILTAIQTLGIRSVKEVRGITGAGTGCNACHRRIQGYIDSVAMPLPMLDGGWCLN